MLTRARGIQFIKYLWIIPVITLLVAVVYFQSFDEPKSPTQEAKGIDVVSLQKFIKEEVAKYLTSNTIPPASNNVEYAPVKSLADSEKLRILITGGAGFVGSHLVDRLMTEGHYVIVLDNFFTGFQRNIQQWMGHSNFELLRHDIVEPLKLEVDQIYHLACPASPVHYRKDPIKTIITNTRGTINMLGLAKRVKARMLLASSSDIYGDPTVHPQGEEYVGHVNPIGPRACYDEGKRVAETMMYAYHSQSQVDIRVARIFNTYGPRMHPDDGRVVSNFITQALQGKDITVYGTGSQTRSFQYIDDLVEGLIRLMASNYSLPVNIGNPEEYTIKDLAEKVVSKASSHSHVHFLPGTVDDPQRRNPDITVAKNQIGWTPKVSVDEGLTRTIEYFKTHMQPANSAEMKFKNKKT